MDLQNAIRAELEEAAGVLQAFMSEPANLDRIEQAAEMIVSALRAGGKVISCGNGGSQCDAMHFAEELSGRYRDERPAMAAIAISDISHATCVGNDYGFESIFSRFVEGLGRPGDVLFGLSTSGNSANVLKAVAVARSRGMKVILLTGKDGGKMGPLADIEVRVPHFRYSDRIQEMHIKVIHILIMLIERLMAGK